MLGANKKLGIYIHWPYCSHICPYCDFNIYRARGRDNDGLIAAIMDEIRHWYKKTNGRKLHSLYFGGGTPSLIEPNKIAKIIELCDDLWGFEESPEICLEANPNEYEKFQDFRNAGIERLSLGVQSFLDNGLKDLGRFHDAQQSIKSVEIARQIMPRLSLDLIYARQNQSLEDWEFELNKAVTLGVDHISPYQLTIEPNTAFDRKLKRGAINIPDDDLGAQFYEMTQEILQTHNFIPYEISNHAKGMNSISRHNLLYWQSNDWLGIGPGAHGRLWENGQRHAYFNSLKPDEYIEDIKSKGNSLIEDETLNDEEIRQEYFIMGLRLENGIEYKNYNLEQENLKHLKDLGLIEYNETRLRLMPKARTISNAVIAQIIEN